MRPIVAPCVLVLMVAAAAMAVDPSSQSVGSPKANLQFADFPSRFADGNCLQGLPRPGVLAGADRPVFCRSDKPLLFDMHHTPMPTKLVLDESGGTGKGYDTLYVDFDDDGDFTNNPSYKATAFAGTMFPEAAPVVVYFRDVRLPRDRRQGKSAHVQIYIEMLPGWPQEVTALHPRIIPQRWAVGTVALGDKQVPAAVIDRNWDETYVEKAGLNLAQYRTFPRGDYLVLGLDGEPRLIPCDLDASSGSPRLVLTEYAALDGQVYQVRAEKLADGVCVELLPAELPMGTLRFGMGFRADRLVLVGTKVCAVAHRARREIRVPADTYVSARMGENLMVVRPGEPLPQEPARPATATQPGKPGPAPSLATQPLGRPANP